MPKRNLGRRGSLCGCWGSKASVVAGRVDLTDSVVVVARCVCWRIRGAGAACGEGCKG